MTDQTYGPKFIIMGVSGCGKSTVGAALSDEIGAVFMDGDDLHPIENVNKMSTGTPLTDADRAPWLRIVGDQLANATGPMIIACSALKRSYRDIIRTRTPATFLHLHGRRTVIEARMSARQDHFMPTALLDSQFAALEHLENDEVHIVVDVDQPLDQIVAEFAQKIRG